FLVFEGLEVFRFPQPIPEGLICLESLHRFLYSSGGHDHSVLLFGRYLLLLLNHLQMIAHYDPPVVLRRCRSSSPWICFIHSSSPALSATSASSSKRISLLDQMAC